MSEPRVWAEDATVVVNPYGLAKVLAEREKSKWHTDVGSKQGRTLKTVHPVRGARPSTQQLPLVGVSGWRS